MKTKKTLLYVVAGLLVFVLAAIGGVYLLWLPHASQPSPELNPAMASFQQLESATQNQPEFYFQNGFLRGALIDVRVEGDSTVERARP